MLLAVSSTSRLPRPYMHIRRPDEDFDQNRRAVLIKAMSLGPTMRTAVATIGIRGTGVYAEADPDKTYLCTCYGTTQVTSQKDPTQRESITSRHHDAPRYVLAEPDSGKRIIPAPFLKHTDLELMTIEAIVGREVPFGLTGSEYEGPRRDY
jgi:hypothetical protein